MPEITVAFYEVFGGHKESEELINFVVQDEPTYKKGDEVSVLEMATGQQINIKDLVREDSKATHKIVAITPPVIVFTKNVATGEKIVTSKIYIYYLKKLETVTGAGQYLRPEFM